MLNLSAQPSGRRHEHDLWSSQSIQVRQQTFEKYEINFNAKVLDVSQKYVYTFQSIRARTRMSCSSLASSGLIILLLLGACICNLSFSKLSFGSVKTVHLLSHSEWTFQTIMFMYNSSYHSFWMKLRFLWYVLPWRLNFLKLWWFIQLPS